MNLRTVSFFSFKGGVGRTNLMLNVAYGLAQRGDFVVIADWDLHAPGFSLNPLFYRPNLEPAPKHDSREGVLDFLDSALNPANQTEITDPANLAQPTVLGHQDRASGRLHRQGDIWCIPAGRFDPTTNPHDYHEQLRRVQGRNLAQWLLAFKHQTTDQPISDPHALLDFFRQRIATIRHPETNQTPDWLLIDSRTGMTEIGDLLLHTNFIDRMVLVSGFNEQNLAGIETIIRSVQKNSEYGVLHTLLSLVFSPVPLGEEQLKQQRLDHIHDVLNQLARRDAHGTAELMPNLLTIPYHPRIALREEIMLRDFPHSDMVTAYEQVIAKVQADATENYAAIEQSYRRAIQQDGRAAQPWCGLGDLLQYQLHRYDEAEQAYREAIQRDAKYAVPWHNLGNLLQQHLARYDEAKQAYREAIQRNAQFAYPWHGLGNLLFQHFQRYDEAAEAFRQAAALKQQDPCSVYLTLAELGLVAEQTTWVTEGLTKAQATLKTPQYRQIFALLTLGQALLTQEPDAIRAAHHALIAEQTTGEPAAAGWIFTDQAPFIARLPALERALYQAWVSVWDAQTTTIDPTVAFAAWQAAQVAE